MLLETRDRAAPVAVVTGGARGIGQAIVRELARAGFAVAFSYLSSESVAAELCRELLDRGLDARASRVDARDIAASRAFVADVIRRHGRLDVLVNNAGIVCDRLLPTMREEDFCGVLSTSLHGMFGASQAAAMQMMRQRRGRIVNITSVSGLMGIAGQANYASAKAAIIGFTRSLAKELAGWGVPVNAVAPGYVDTDMLSSQTSAQRAAALERVPMRRFGAPEEIARVVRFLAVDAPSYLTGQALVIDGGLTSALP